MSVDSEDAESTPAAAPAPDPVSGRLVTPLRGARDAGTRAGRSGAPSKTRTCDLRIRSPLGRPGRGPHLPDTPHLSPSSPARGPLIGRSLPTGFGGGTSLPSFVAEEFV